MLGVSIALDTNVAVHCLNEREPYASRFRAETRVALPVIVVGELLFGAQNSRLRTQNGLRYQQFVSNALVLNVDRGTADHYAELRLQLKTIGRPIPENDLWIAALCRQHNLVLVTEDAHFRHCAGLLLESWQSGGGS